MLNLRFEPSPVILVFITHGQMHRLIIQADAVELAFVFIYWALFYIISNDQIFNIVQAKYVSY